MAKLTRRMFLKLATAGAGLAVIESTFSPILRADELIKAGKSVSRTTGLPRRGVPSTCLMCPARCGILAFVEDNAVVKIEGNPRDPNNRGRLCAKGQAGVNIMYNPDRLLYPIRRKGPRGSGSWVRISWDEALEEMAARLATLQTNNGANDLVLIGGMLEGIRGVTGRFARAFGTTKVFDEAALYNANKVAAQRMTWGADFEVPDLARTRYILNFGANPSESHPLHVPMVQRMVDAQLSGAKLVTFDPRLSATAARSAEWFASLPGSDAIVALAMANVIVQRGLYDADFVSQWFNIELDALAQHLGQYNLGVAAAASGVRANDIERIAIEFASQKPATTISGGGLSQHTDGVTAERAVALLNGLIGNVDIVGGYGLPRQYTFGEPDPVPPASEQPTCATCAGIPQFFQAVQQQNEHPGVLITNMANPVFTAPMGETIANVLKDERLVPYHVAFDSYLTETAVLADIVLPAATYLESWDVQSPPAFDMVPFVSIMQPALKPLGESMSFNDALIDLGKRIGGDVGFAFGFGSMEAYVSSVLSKVPGLDKAGGLDYLKRYGAWVDPFAVRTERSYQKAGFRTPSGKFEVAVADLAARGIPALPTAAKVPSIGNELSLVTFQFAVHTYGRTANSMWLSEIAHDNPVWIHPDTASDFKIKRGDKVKVTTEAGTIETIAFVTQAIHPDVIAIGMGVGHWASSRIAQAKRFKSEEPNTEHMWWSKHSHAVHPYPLIPLATDPVGAGQTWQAVRASISKA